MKDITEQIYDELSAQVVRLLDDSMKKTARIVELETENTNLRYELNAALSGGTVSCLPADSGKLREEIRNVEISTSGSKGYAKAWNEGAEHMRDAIINLVESTAVQAPVREVPGWKPIETAPKDGSHIILTNGEMVAQGWWEHEEPYIREQRNMEGNYIDQQEHDGFDGWLDCEGGMQPDPTHWMPLPAAPVQTEGE